MKELRLPPFLLNVDMETRILQVRRWNRFDVLYNDTVALLQLLSTRIFDETCVPMPRDLCSLIADFAAGMGYTHHPKAGLLIGFASDGLNCLYGASGIPPWRWCHESFILEWCSGIGGMVRSTLPVRDRHAPPLVGVPP
jgi:hypothetical protein